MTNKLYCEMTSKQQREYRTNVVTKWIKDGFTFALVRLPRKVRNRDGWYWTSDWCWKDSDSDLKPIDKELLENNLGIKETIYTSFLAEALKDNGFDIFDLGEVIVFNPKNYKK